MPRRHFLAAFLFALTLHAADPEPRWLALRRASNQAIEAKDYAKLRTVLTELKPLMPGNPNTLYNLAAADAVLGNRDQSLAGLAALADSGIVFDYAADSDFASLAADPRFAAVLARTAANRNRVATAIPAFSIPQSDILPEDIAYDSKTRRFFISSARLGAIFTADGKKFAETGWGTLALRADSRRRILWATAGWLPHCDACQGSDADKDRTALFAFDLDSGRQLRNIPSPVPGLLGDMTISSRGDLYISEGIHGAVLRLKQGDTTVERIDIPGEFPSPQTPALSLDEKTLYVPDYVRGIAAIRLADRHVEWLQPAPGVVLSGIDGLYVDRTGFIAVQNGINPPRIVRFPIDLKSTRPMEVNSRGLGEPTHGVLVNGDFYFLANTGWSAYDGSGKKKPGVPPVQSEVRKLTRAR